MYKTTIVTPLGIYLNIYKNNCPLYIGKVTINIVLCGLNFK